MVTSDLARVTTLVRPLPDELAHCGDVRSRTSYNKREVFKAVVTAIVVTSDLGRVTTLPLRSLSILATLW